MNGFLIAAPRLGRPVNDIASPPSSSTVSSSKMFTGGVESMGGLGVGVDLQEVGARIVAEVIFTACIDQGNIVSFILHYIILILLTDTALEYS